MSRVLKSVGILLSTQTIKNRLKERGFAYRFPAYKPVLTQKQKQNRLKFAKENRTRDWNQLVFTDEATIRLSPNVNKIWKKRGKPVCWKI